MSKKKFIAIRNQADGTNLELYFLDIIEDKYDWWSGESTSTVQQTINQVNLYKPKKITVIIDSVGGDLQIALSLYNFLKNHDAKIEVEIIGLAASAATVLAMAANPGKLKIARNAFFMIHRASAVVAGTAEEIRQGAAMVDIYDRQAVDVYSQRTGKTAEEINALLDNGHYWMTGQDAVDQGFADAIINEATPVISIAARANELSAFSNIPASIRAQMAPGNGPGADDDQSSFFTQHLSEMKKFFTDISTEIRNAIRGIKTPADTTDTTVENTLTNQVAEAVVAPFERIGEEIETTINNTVNTAITSEPVTTAIGNQVTTAVNNALDMANPESPISKLITQAVTNATTGLQTTIDEQKLKIEDLEKDITNKLGAGNKTDENKENVVVPIGQFK